MPDFAKRSTQTEMMDDFSLGADTIHPIMDELEVINNLLGGYSVFFHAFRQIGISDGMTISDWGCGGGDSLRKIALWAKRKDLSVNLVGLDATPSAIAYATRKSLQFPEISYQVCNVLSDELQPDQFDVVISSLFTHHFGDEDWIRLIQQMFGCAKTAVVINDLHRHWFAYHSIGILTRLFSRSVMVKHDSQLSVLRSFTEKEIADLLTRAGIKNYKIKWKWAFRYQVILYKN
jgi:2-polyprenyl-3-methyl-5-hydroxy-6-metoxy-1,4-benzoquinol methylase